MLTLTIRIYSISLLTLQYTHLMMNGILRINIVHNKQTGSLFEITGGGETKLGFGPTAALAAIGLPLSIFLIYAAILKGAAETEEDDKEYNKPRKL